MFNSANRLEMRVVNSRAALSVNVTTSNDSGATSLWVIRYTILSTRVNVLPEPGPAMINKGPSVASIARIWLGFALLSIAGVFKELWLINI